ncbi:MAG: hypothetical protein DRQ49_09040 [Gammaproteobacteria bacterium]|nr:MAG: hypothetical protein DRQ49_09040 [Gammaproteobacteria bacterium]RKZ44069.1 MAG: hypothetical protein DRQ41_03720 [Gammaproteobacteria bacterium]RKZ75993.1 MAG: hypothetical protein DRQ57_05415 [Gammaproteobacteria bacterium]
MKSNILRAAVAASILGVSCANFSETYTPFNGMINGCNITKISDGVLVWVNNIFTSEPEEGGTRAVIEVTSTGTCSLSVAFPTNFSDGMEGGATNAEVYDSADGGIKLADAAIGTIYNHPTGTKIYYVNMFYKTSNGSNVSPGTYNYTVAVIR